MVDAKAVRAKLSKQLKIDLEPHEKVHIHKEDVNHAEMSDRQLDDYVMNAEHFGDRDIRCATQIKVLGQYIARISLNRGHSIPIKFEIIKR
jgi:hypothetical protein